MSVTHEEVLRIARLAELDVDEATLPVLTERMSRIRESVAQIGDVPASESAKPFVPGPDAVRFRADEVKPWPLGIGARHERLGALAGRHVSDLGHELED